jgi:polysaccharide chain length determinant protein (PEP-CTERM system associated)
MHELADQLVSALRAAWRYRWYAAIVAWLFALAGWTAVYLTPDRFEANARVYVNTQSMLRPLLSGLAVQPNIDQVLAMMARTLVSRVNVEKVIQMAGMEPEHATPYARERLIADLTKDIAITSAGRENLYTITYADEDREQAQRVVESLLKLFMEGKRSDTVSARQFIEDQLRTYGEKLVAAENAVTEFKRRHQGLMPGEGRDYYGRLSDARTALRQATLELKEALDARDAIKRQLAGEVRMSPRPDDKHAAVGPPSELDGRIAALEQKLDNLRLQYTEQHPDIVASEHVIAQLRAQKRAEEMKQRAVVDSARNSAPAAPQGQVYEQLTISLATAEARVASTKARVAEYESRHRELQADAHAVPQIEAEFKQLTRDYEVTKARYDKLLERRESAQITGDVETSEVAIEFRVVDPPRVPLKPSWPNRPKLMTAVLVAALAAGFGVAFVLSHIRKTFNDERSLRQASGLPVWGSVAMTWNEKQKKRRARAAFAFVLSFLGLLSAYGTIMASLVLAVPRV